MSGPGKPHVYHPVSRYLLPTFLPNHPISESRKIIHVPAQVFLKLRFPNTLDFNTNMVKFWLPPHFQKPPVSLQPIETQGKCPPCWRARRSDVRARGQRADPGPAPDMWAATKMWGTIHGISLVKIGLCSLAPELNRIGERWCRSLMIFIRMWFLMEFCIIDNMIFGYTQIWNWIYSRKNSDVANKYQQYRWIILGRVQE